MQTERPVGSLAAVRRSAFVRINCWWILFLHVERDRDAHTTYTDRAMPPQRHLDVVPALVGDGEFGTLLEQGQTISLSASPLSNALALFITPTTLASPALFARRGHSPPHAY